MFRDEHLGKAVALRREMRGMKQIALARAIGVTKGTMNGYERGSRGMDVATLERISASLGCDAIAIWDDAYKIFRYNYLLERAETLGMTVEELAQRDDPRPSIDQIQQGFQAVQGDLWQVMSQVLAFLRPDRYDESRSGVPVWGVIVSPRSQSRRAVGFRRGKKPRAKAAPRNGD